MANFRPEYDAERSLIRQLALGYFTSPDADAQLKKVYDRSFAPLATEYEEAHRGPPDAPERGQHRARKTRSPPTA
jgi:hypothetical protein